MWRKLISWHIEEAPPKPEPEPEPEPQPEPVLVHEEAPSELLRRLHWTVLRPLATYLGGSERSLVRGPGMELAEVREYQPGDDVRFIDWKITARTDTPYVREAHVERALDTWVLLDLSASVDWGTAECLKRQRGMEFVIVAGELLSRHGNRLGGLLFADRPLEIVPPGSGRSHLLHFYSRIRNVPRQDRRASTDLTGALAKASTVIQRRALVLVVSDFLTPDGWQNELRRLAQRHEVIAVRLQDPRESALPDVGMITLEDPETGEQITIDTGDRRLRERFERAAEAQALRLRDEIIACGAALLDVRTDQDLLHTLVRFLHVRRLQRTAMGRPGQQPSLSVSPF